MHIYPVQPISRKPISLFYVHLCMWQTKLLNLFKTFSNGYLGSRNDEERSEMRYVMRIAELSESSSF